jgi:hypothetical protein
MHRNRPIGTVSRQRDPHDLARGLESLGDVTEGEPVVVGGLGPATGYHGHANRLDASAVPELCVA